MEHVGHFYDEEFDFYKMFSNVDADFLMSNNPAENLSQNFDIVPPSFFPETTIINTNNNHLMAKNIFLPSFETFNINSYISQESSNISGSDESHQVYFPNASCEDHQDANINSFLTLTNDNNGHESMNFFAMDNQNDYPFVPTMYDNNDNNVGDNNTYVLSKATHQEVTTTTSSSQNQLKRKFNAANNEKLCNESLEEALNKKKPRAPRNKYKTNNVVTKAKKNKQILVDNIIISSNKNEYKNEESTENAEKQIEIQSSSMSEDGSNVSLESNVGVNTSECKDSSVHDSKGKSRATRGNATDPQSLYARKRRERINERLKILQTLVPNGTKVDISTMLEEAVQYVKFMQLQIQLLSSDNLWMFAPLAYNGIDVGVYQNMFPNL